MLFQVPEYLTHVDKRLNEESERLLHYLDQSTRYVSHDETIILLSYLDIYAIVAGITHYIVAFGVCHVGCKGITHDHVVCFLTMYVFFTM